MKTSLTLLFSFLVINSASTDKECIKGDIKYSVANYSDEPFLKEKFQKLFNSLLQKPVSQFICNETIEDLPTKDTYNKSKISPSQSSIIEPLFIDLASFNGLYSKRIYNLDTKRNPRFRCGFFHYTFLIADNKYIPLTKDTVQNKELITKFLGRNFSEKEIASIPADYKQDIVCDDFTFLPPVLIKKGDAVLFNAYAQE